MKRKILGVSLIALGVLLMGIYKYSTKQAIGLQQSYINILQDSISWEDDNYVYFDNELVKTLKDTFNNKDIVGYIDCKEAGISYPIVKSKDNKEYLEKDIYGKYSFAGSIFIDKRNNDNFSDAVTSLYGHNMLDGSMFGNLEEYVKSSEEKSLVKVYTRDKLMIYEFSSYEYVNDTKANANVLVSNSQEEFTNWLYSVSNSVKIKDDIKNSRFMNLVTCHYNGSTSSRLVVTYQLQDIKEYKVKEN